MLLQTTRFYSLWLSNIPLYTFYLFINYVHVMASMNSVAINMGMQVSPQVASFLLVINPIGLLDHMVVVVF